MIEIPHHLVPAVHGGRIDARGRLPAGREARNQRKRLASIKIGDRVGAGQCGRGHKAERSEARAGQRFRSGLVIAEVAFAMLLLVGAGLLIRSLQQLASIRPGYDPSHVLALRLSLPRLAG